MYKSRTSISFEGTRILINNRPAYEGREKVEGLLFNIRTVNATFDDTLGEVSWWDDDGSRPENCHAGYGPWRSPESANANTQRFIQALPEYKAWGVLGINLNFQGGHPLQGKPWIAEGHGRASARENGHRDFYHNSGFRADGSMDEDYARRISSVIEACDRLGMVVILQLFYFGQDTVFSDEDAIRTAADNAVDFVCQRGYRNVLIEIANEISRGHYHNKLLKPDRVVELIQRVRERSQEKHGQKLLISTSENGLIGASDFILIHGGDGTDHRGEADGTQIARMIHSVRSRPWFSERPRPIITNESEGKLAFEGAVRNGVSFGLHSTPYFQTMWPPKWGVWENDTIWFFRKVKELTCSSG
jgi:hypothetical protein